VYMKRERSLFMMQASQWPQHPEFLIPGVNDSWNDFQKYCKGKVVTGKEWKEARQLLHAEYQRYIAEGGLPASINEETHRFNYFHLLTSLVMFLKFLKQEGGLPDLQSGDRDL
jgi:hypothetical protein